MVFRQQFRTDYRSQLLVPRRMRHHAVHHRLLTSLRCVEHQIFQRCVVECEVPIQGKLLRLPSRFLRLHAFQHDFQQHHERETLKKQLMKPGRHNCLKEMDPSVAGRSCSLLGTSKRVVLLYGAYKPLGRGWEERSNNLLRYQCGLCPVCKSVHPDVMRNVETPFCLRLMGPAEVYAGAVMTR